MGLIDQRFISGSWTAVTVRGTNTSGTPLISAELAETGERISDTYTLTVSARTGGTGTITIATTSPNNPYNGRIKTGLNFDDTTEYTTIVPGVVIVLDNAGANGNSATVIIGSPYGSFDASGIGAGVPTAGVRHRVLNDGASDVANAKAQLFTQVIAYKKVNSVLSYVSPFADNAVEKTAGGGSDRVMPYYLSISSVAGSGSGKTATLNIDGSPFGAASIFDIDAGTSQNSTLLKAITPGYRYRVIDGPLEGLEFELEAGVANSDGVNVLVFPSRYIQIAPDVAGVEGTYGVSAVDLTETGEATGVITAAGVAYFWTRFLVPQGANNESNPYPCKVALTASQSSDAGWEE